jgi:hypothetical protein
MVNLRKGEGHMPDIHARATTPSENEVSSISPEGTDTLFANYQEYNKTLRAWLVTFGVGVLTLFLLHPDVLKPLKQSGQLRVVIQLYLGGCGAQILIAMLNKFAGWYGYYAAVHPNEAERRWYKFWTWLSNQFWLDMIADIASLILFGRATYIMFATLV